MGSSPGRHEICKKCHVHVNFIYRRSALSDDPGRTSWRLAFTVMRRISSVRGTWREMKCSATSSAISLSSPPREDSSIWECLISIGTPIWTNAGFLLPAAHHCQRDLREQSSGQERFCNIGISEEFENRLVDLRMEVVLQTRLAAIRDQG
jgi:hypothetical protein